MTSDQLNPSDRFCVPLGGNLFYYFCSWTDWTLDSVELCDPHKRRIYVVELGGGRVGYLVVEKGDTINLADLKCTQRDPQEDRDPAKWVGDFVLRLSHVEELDGVERIKQEAERKEKEIDSIRRLLRTTCEQISGLASQEESDEFDADGTTTPTTPGSSASTHGEAPTSGQRDTSTAATSVAGCEGDEEPDESGGAKTEDGPTTPPSGDEATTETVLVVPSAPEDPAIGPDGWPVKNYDGDFTSLLAAPVTPGDEWSFDPLSPGSFQPGVEPGEVSEDDVEVACSELSDPVPGDVPTPPLTGAVTASQVVEEALRSASPFALNPDDRAIEGDDFDVEALPEVGGLTGAGLGSFAGQRGTPPPTPTELVLETPPNTAKRGRDDDPENGSGGPAELQDDNGSPKKAKFTPSPGGLEAPGADARTPVGETGAGT
ncbi:hypothetical protein [Rhizobium terrae]|uniref:hypothetical protein n=1 Tax=Rhizobium terrae TaxID=2171756 RepID=UPI000E3E6CA9|nr:hypothetical protein [Rhizobium terrae]